MINQYYLLYLSDNIEPIKEDKYFVTSLGKAPLKRNIKTNCSCFLSYNQINGSIGYYDSNFDVYYVPSSIIKFVYNQTSDYASFYESKIGNLTYYGNGRTYIEYIKDESDLYVFDFDGDYYLIIEKLVNDLNIKHIYSKKKLFPISQIIRFYFKGKKSIRSDSFVVLEGLKSGLIGDIKSDIDFKYGSWEYEYNKEYVEPLLMWPRKDNNYTSKLIKVNYYRFLQYIQKIEEFDFNEAIDELSCVESMGGEFYLLEDEGVIKGGVVLEKYGQTYIYVSYLSILKEYRKTNASSLLIDSIKSIGVIKERNLILTIEVPKLLDFYIKHGFKVIGKWMFS